MLLLFELMQVLLPISELLLATSYFSVAHFVAAFACI
jgi:hypothetical protein